MPWAVFVFGYLFGWGFGFRVSGLGFRAFSVQGLGFRVQISFRQFWGLVVALYVVFAGWEV